MATRVGATLSERLLILFASVVAIFVSWSVIRYWLVSVSFPDRFIHFIDVGVVVVTGIAATITLVRLIARPVAARAGPTQINTLKLLFQLLGLGIILVALIILSGPTGTSFLSALVGIGFFGIVVGLAAQAVLGNLFSGLMLLAARPFKINDRIALITWQYGKFAPSLAHGWMEPAYTGVVKGISLTYTRILTDSNALLKVPNSIVTQSLIMNLTHGRQGMIAIQFEAPIQVDPRDLRKNLNSTLSKMSEFKGEEDNFEILEASPTGYLVSMSYKVEKQTERQMKSILLNGVRNVLNDAREQSAKGAK
jgi:small-conductance mechanosensitive channel